MALWREDRDLNQAKRCLEVLAQPHPGNADEAVLADHYRARAVAGYLLYADHVGTDVGDLGGEESVAAEKAFRRLRGHSPFDRPERGAS